MTLRPYLLPLLLVLVAALLAVYVVLQLRRKTFVARFSNVELLGSVAPRRPGWSTAAAATRLLGDERESATRAC